MRGMSTSETAGEEAAPPPGLARQHSASDPPGKVELDPSPVKSTTVAGRSRRLTGSDRERSAGALRSK